MSVYCYEDETENRPLLMARRLERSRHDSLRTGDSSCGGTADSFDNEITAALNSSLRSLDADENEIHGLRFSVFRRVALLPKGRLSGVLSLLLVHFCSRLAHFSILGNLVLYLVCYVNVGQDIACVISLVWLGVSYVLPLVGGFLADTRLGRHRAILLGLFFYCIATGLLPLHAASVDVLPIPDSAHGNISNHSNASLGFESKQSDTIVLSNGAGVVLLVVALVLCSFGSALLWPNIPVFGADQFLLWSAGALPIRSFFHWLFWVANMAALIAFTGVAYVQQYISFVYGYLPAAIAMVITTIVYICVLYRHVYHVDSPDRQAFGEAIGVVGEGLRLIGQKQATLRHERLKLMWLDAAKIVHGGSYSAQTVEEVKAIYRFLPLFTMLIMYWTAFSQARTTFLLQGIVLDLFRGSVRWATATLPSLGRMSLLVLLPLTDRVLYPFLSRRGCMPLATTRILIGFFLAILAMISAGLVEVKRLTLMQHNDTITQTWSRHHGFLVLAANLSVFVQTPQYVALAISELLTYVTVMELAYSKSAPATHGFVMGILDAFRGLGSFFGAALILIINAISRSASGQPWYPVSHDFYQGRKDSRHFGHADYYFFTLAGLMVINSLVLIAVVRWYGNRLADAPISPVAMKYTRQVQSHIAVQSSSASQQVLVGRSAAGREQQKSQEEDC